MFEFLFKFPVTDYQQGSIEISYGWLAFSLLAFLFLASSIIFQVLRGQSFSVPLHQSLTIALVHGVLFTLLLWSLFNPVLLVDQPREEDVRVAVLIDNSLSMRVADNGESVSSALVEQFSPQRGSFTSNLNTRFSSDFYRFGQGVSTLDSDRQLSLNGAASNLSKAIEGVVSTYGIDEALAIVLVSDGQFDVEDDPESLIGLLRDRDVPVYSLGMGSPMSQKDVRITHLEAPRYIRMGDNYLARLKIEHNGLAGESIRVIMDDTSQIVSERTIILADENKPQFVELEYQFEVAGPHELTFRIPRAADEQITLNNRMPFSVEVSGEPIDIVHVEGEPRFEVKFLRRALEKDSILRLASLVHTSDSNLIRLGVNDPEELESGFPRSREELFRYEGIVLGSYPAERLTDEQLNNLHDFVSIRGGGLVVLGGRMSFTDGDWQNTPLQTMLPVMLDSAPTPPADQVSVIPTEPGLVHPVSRELFNEADTLLPLAFTNRTLRHKPGAMVLLSGSNGNETRRPVLTVQRFGRGHVAAFPVRNSWRWHMRRDLETDRNPHGHLWRQLLRWTTLNAGPALSLDPIPNGAVGQALEITARALGPDYQTGRQVRPIFSVISPSGVEAQYPMTAIPGTDGLYRVGMQPDEAGRHELRLGDGAMASAASVLQHVDITVTGSEFLRPGLNPAPLRQLSAATDGDYFDQSGLEQLVGAIKPKSSGQQEQIKKSLWDLPIVFLLILTLLGANGWLRRRWGFR